MTKIFKIYLGLKNPITEIEYCELEVINLIKKIVNSATIYHTKGLWRGHLETTLVIEILENEFYDYNRIKDIAKYLMNEYEQQAVMVTQSEIECEFFNSREF